jgi:uncharacterized protein
VKRDYLHLIDEFLGLKRIALVGASRNARSLSRALMNELVRRGYDVIPVNPNARDLDGYRCVQSVAQIDPPPNGALIMRTPERTADAVRECLDAGVRRIWLHRGSQTPHALDLMREAGVAAIPGECMFMYLPDASLIHRIHRAIDRFTGRYPH